jgi:hypothetical protein
MVLTIRAIAKKTLERQQQQIEIIFFLSLARRLN